MKDSASSSVSNTGATSASVPPRHGGVAANKTPDAALSETEFLKRQADQASLAMRAAAHDLSRQFRTAADVRNWTRQYPWAAAGVAAAAGFAAAFVLTPRDRADARQKWESLKSGFASKEGDIHEERHERKRERPSFLATLMTELVKMLRPIIVGLVTNMAGAAPPETNGHDVPPDSPGAQI